MSRREVIVTDIETSGFDPTMHTCVEVGWWNLNTGARGHFIPPHNPDQVLADGDPQALEICRYQERIMEQPQDFRYEGLLDFSRQIHGNTPASSNVRFDMSFLDLLFARREGMDIGSYRVPSYHHRLWELSPYAAGLLKLDYLPGLHEVCERLKTPLPDHTSDGDVIATGIAFLELFRIAGIERR